MSDEPADLGQTVTRRVGLRRWVLTLLTLERSSDSDGVRETRHVLARRSGDDGEVRLLVVLGRSVNGPRWGQEGALPNPGRWEVCDLQLQDGVGGALQLWLASREVGSALRAVAREWAR